MLKIITSCASFLCVVSCSQEKTLEYEELNTFGKIENHALEDPLVESLKKEPESIPQALSPNFTKEDIGWLLMPALGGQFDEATLRDMIDRDLVKGFMILGKNVDQESSDRLIDFAIDDKNFDPLVSIDAEPSLLPYRMPDLKGIPLAHELQTEEAVKAAVQEINKVLKDKRIDINFAPVADNGSNVEIIGNRAFGTDPEVIVKLSKVFVDESLNNGILPTVKHFPGHGFVVGDSHETLPIIDGALNELEVFDQILKNSKVPLVMVGHLAVQNNERFDTEGKPATLSNKIVQELLREELDYQGVIITDAMNMGALDGYENVEMQALEAGADIILMPHDPEVLIEQIWQKTLVDEEFKREIGEKIERVKELGKN